MAIICPDGEAVTGQKGEGDYLFVVAPSSCARRCYSFKNPSRTTAQFICLFGEVGNGEKITGIRLATGSSTQASRTERG
ncbi:hypothetical protein TMatcc_005689 [Talaromyces marneffei ATCC 18224]